MAERTPNERTNTERTNTGEPRLSVFVSWAVLFASFGLSASTWIALARLAGYTEHLELFGHPFALAWLMPIAFDGYVVCSLILWTAPVPEQIATFARKNTYGAASVGVFAQSAYHLSITATSTHSPWRSALAVLVGAIPPGVAALAVHMRALLRRHAEQPTVVERPARVRVERPVRTPAPITPEQPNTPNAAITEHPNDRERSAPAVIEQPARTNTNPEQSVPITNVRPITAARTRSNATKAQKIEQVKNARTDWATNTPSVRDIAVILSCAPSTAHPIAQALAAEAAQVPVPAQVG